MATFPAVMHETSWMGVPALKNPLDAWIYQEIIAEVRPEAIVELGNRFGGGTLFLCHMLDLLSSPDGIVVAVDISHKDFAAEHPRIAAVEGDTASPDVIARVRELCEGRRTLVIHDADHRAGPVLTDLRNYSPLVSPGSYLIVEDGLGDVISARKGGRGAKNPGPLAAVDQFLRETNEFEVDEARERWVLTYNPRGFLRRR
jgi:cephalosporin hydroxylase